MSSRPAQRFGIVLLLACATKAAPAQNLGFIDAATQFMLQPGQVAPAVLVSARTEAWQGSGILLQAGATYRITAEGRWQIGGVCNPTGPDGLNPYTLACWDGPGNYLPDASHSTLIGRLGNDGAPFVIGAQREFIAGNSGALYMLVNDTPGWFFDNTGQVNVRVQMIGAAPGMAGGSPAPGTTTEIIIRQETPRSSETIEIRRGGGGGGGGGGGSTTTR